MRWHVALLVAMLPIAARADERVEVLPGASRAINHALSASRDTALLGLALTPYSVLTAGGDVGLVKVALRDTSLRFGFFGMLELESDRPWSGRQPDFLPRENSQFWRAVGGWSLAASLDGLAQRTLGDGAALEASLSLRHESEHHTDGPRDEGIPHIGNCVLADAAVRVPAGPVDVELRLQTKLFLGERSYTVGPGADLIVRWRLSRWVQPFSSTFAEVLLGAGEVPDDVMLRNLTGVILPGRIGDLQVFTSVEIGNGKSLNVYKREARWGGGVRLAFF